MHTRITKNISQIKVYLEENNNALIFESRLYYFATFVYIKHVYMYYISVSSYSPPEFARA